MKDFILYKILRRKKPVVEPVVEPEKFYILATFYMKDKTIHKILGKYESSNDLLDDILRIMKEHDHITGINIDKRRVIIRTGEIDYVEVETKEYECDEEQI